MRAVPASLGLLLVTAIVLAGCGHSSPQTPRVGSTVAMGKDKDAISLEVESVLFSRRVNFLDYGSLLKSLTPSNIHGGVNAPKGKTFIVLTLLFTGVGLNGYHSTVPAWSWLAINDAGTATTVRACGFSSKDPYTDEQSTMWGPLPEFKLKVKQDQMRSWKVAFLVPDGAQPVSFTYQGPDNQRVTWKL